jgi:hypothetical protein
MVCLDANAEIAKGRLVQISALRGQPLLDVLHGLDRAAQVLRRVDCLRRAEISGHHRVALLRARRFVNADHPNGIGRIVIPLLKTTAQVARGLHGSAATAAEECATDH